MHRHPITVLCALLLIAGMAGACADGPSAPSDTPQLAKAGGIPQYCTPYPYVLGADHIQSQVPAIPEYGQLVIETGYIDCIRVYQGIVGHCDYMMPWHWGDPKPQPQQYITTGCEEGGPN